MPARDFINDTLMPWLKSEIEAPAPGNKHYLHGFEDALKALTHFIELHRDYWDRAD